MRRCAVVRCAVVLAAALGAGGCSPSQERRHGTAQENSVVVPVTSLTLRDGVAAEVRHACRELRGRVRVPRVCPSRYPASGFVETGSSSVDLSLRAPNVYSRDLYELTFNNGNTRGYVHWVMGVGTREAFELHVLSGRFNEVPGRARRVGVQRAQGKTIRLYEFGSPRGGPNSGHVIAAIGIGRFVVYGSVHHFRHRDYAIALALDAAAQLEPNASSSAAALRRDP